MKYKFIKQNNALTPQDGEYLMVDLKVKNLYNDSIIFNTADHQTLLPVRHDSYKMKVGLDNPMEEVFHQMGLGDSVVFLLPAKELLNTAFAPSLPPDLSLEEEVEIAAKAISVLPYEEYKDWQTRQVAQQTKLVNQRKDVRLEEEKAMIKELLDKEGIEYQATASGIHYYITEEGKGPKPKNGDSVHFQYTIQYTDGTQLEGDIGHSGKDGKSFVMGKNSVLPCWQESIAMLSPGAKGRFYFPSACAFGESGTYGVRPNSILVIDLELERLN